jgi:hypothetical protein
MNSQSNEPQNIKYAVVANAPVKAALLIGDNPLTLEGTFSLHLEVSLNELESGIVNLRGSKLVFSQVPQPALSQITSERIHAPLGILMQGDGGIQLKIDAEHETFRGSIPVRAYFPQIDEIFPPKFFDSSGRNDYSISRTQEGNIDLSIKAKPLFTLAAGTNKMSDKPIISLSAQIRIKSLTFGRRTIPDYEIEITGAELPVETAGLEQFAVIKKFGVQLVSIGEGPNDASATGRGFSFGKRAIDDLWGTFGVLITVNPDWIYIDVPEWKIAGETAADAILMEVDRRMAGIVDFIGIVFVENFDPEGLYGGGRTIRSGMIDSRIITSDGNVDQNDRTHLAHELGHALGLVHPDEKDATLRTATAGTLMEPSGWQAQNPYLNSQENADNVRSGTFGIMERALLPDE